MKKSELKKVLLESVREIVKEDNINLDELDFGGMFKYTPPTDEQIDAYLRSRPKDKAILDKDPERKEKWINFIKTNKDAGKALKAKEIVFAVWDPQAKEYSARKTSGMNSPTSFGEGKSDKGQKIFVVTGPDGVIYGARFKEEDAKTLEAEKTKDLAMGGSHQSAGIKAIFLK